MNKYREPGKVSRAAVTKQLIKMGYTVESLEQLWRHLTGRVERDGQPYFLKVATSEAIGKLTAIEPDWYQQMNERLVDTKQPFRTPAVHESGMLTMPDKSTRFFYISDFIDGQQLATKYPPDTRNLADWLDRIAEVTIFMLNCKGFTSSKPEVNRSERIKAYRERYRKWAEEAGENLDDLIEVADSLPDTYESRMNHGDFVPWHMLQDGERFVLIDAEHAGVKKPKYYDTAYFYHRVYTAAESPELAKKYLAALSERLSAGERKNLIDELRPILAGRAIGGYWDFAQGDKSERSYHDALRKDIVENSLV